MGEYHFFHPMKATFPTSVRLTKSNKEFVKQFGPLHDMSDSEVINKALKIYSNYHLSQMLIAEATENPARDVAMANEDFKSYQQIIEDAEAV